MTKRITLEQAIETAETIFVFNDRLHGGIGGYDLKTRDEARRTLEGLGRDDLRVFDIRGLARHGKLWLGT